MTNLLMAFMAFFSMSGSTYDLTIPKTWEKDFTINVSYRGSMRGGTSEIKFTYDSCTYIVNPYDGPKETKTYALTENDRAAILKKLHSFNLGNIDRNRETVPVRDGWSQSICFGFECIEGGPSVDLTEIDKSTFLTAYSYLEQFAIDKTK